MGKVRDIFVVLGLIPTEMVDGASIALHFQLATIIHSTPPSHPTPSPNIAFDRCNNLTCNLCKAHTNRSACCLGHTRGCCLCRTDNYKGTVVRSKAKRRRHSTQVKVTKLTFQRVEYMIQSITRHRMTCSKHKYSAEESLPANSKLYKRTQI